MVVIAAPLRALVTTIDCHDDAEQRPGISSQAGFNLIERASPVELMIVIVIVGILSAVALPNFLSQTDKAKATEAKTVASSYLKQIYAAYQEGGSTAAGATDGTGSIPCPLDTKYFGYTCDEDGDTNQIVATGLAASGNLLNATITSSVALKGVAADAQGAGGVRAGLSQ